jgi:hypothetical protein
MAGAKAQIEYMPLSQVRGALRNPKDHDIGELHLSIERFGFADPPTINERTGRLVEGHGRVETLRQMKVAGEPEPRYIRREGDEWMVPVVRGLSWQTDEEAEAYLIAHNRITEKGGWLDSVLTNVVSDLAAADALIGTGYDEQDVDRLLGDAARTDNALQTFEAETIEEVELSEQAKLNPEDRLEQQYNTSTIRQIQLIMGVPEYEWALGILSRVRAHYEVDTNTDAVFELFKEFDGTHPDLDGIPEEAHA